VPQWFANLLSQADARGKRSTVIDQLKWFVAIGVGGLVTSAAWGNPVAVALCAGIVVVFGLLAAVSYVYFMFKDPDCLRSEEYALKQTMIREGIYGDNTNPIAPRATEIEDVESVPALIAKSQGVRK